MSDANLILRMNLLNEFIEKDINNFQDSLQEKIKVLFNELENSELSDDERKTLQDLKGSYYKRKESRRDSPLDDLRVGSLKRSFLKFRGLVFDLKTRFDYISAEVAIQDGLDLSEYFREVIEEINNDLNESLVVENQKLSKVRDDISQYYALFSRKRLRDLYPQIATTLKEFREALDELNISVS